MSDDSGANILSTGLPRLDAAVGGFRQGRVYVVWDPTTYVGSGLIQTIVHEVTGHGRSSALIFSSLPVTNRYPEVDPGCELEFRDIPTPLPGDERILWYDLAPAVAGTGETCRTASDLTTCVERLERVPDLIILDDLNTVSGEGDPAFACAAWARQFDRPVVIVAVAEALSIHGQWRPAVHGVPGDLARVADVLIIVTPESSVPSDLAPRDDEERWCLEVHVRGTRDRPTIPVMFSNRLFCREPGTNDRCPDDCRTEVTS